MVTVMMAFMLLLYYNYTQIQKKVLLRGINAFKTVSALSSKNQLQYLEEILRHQNLTLVKADLYPEILQHGVEVSVNEFSEEYSRITRQRFQIVEYHEHIFFYIKIAQGYMLLKDQATNIYFPHHILLLFIATLTIIMGTFVMLRRSILPLRLLEGAIRDYGQGKYEFNLSTAKTDEISMVANEFDKAVKKIEKLQESRTLFMRNIMHELKTPITKGKICTEMVSDTMRKKIFTQVFDRMEELINEMAAIEKLTTNNLELELKSHKWIDIVENATDLLLVEHDRIEHNIADEKIRADFKWMSIALKNLIDNGMKYSCDGKVEVMLEGERISVANCSVPLENPLEHYLEPFITTQTHYNNNGTSNSFGLGLYIVSEIVKLHGYSLTHQYYQGKNYFIIDGSPSNSQ